jgi:hypothetical protein
VAESWVAELHTVLDSIQRFLDAEEHALASEDLRIAQQAWREVLAIAAPDLTARIAASRAQLTELVGRFSEQQHAEHRAYAALHLHRFARQAPLLRRALDKPLGYAGDYELTFRSDPLGVRGQDLAAERRVPSASPRKLPEKPSSRTCAT